MTDELKKIYSSNPKEYRYYDTVEISHSTFTKSWFMVKDDEHHLWTLETGVFQLFSPFAFAIKLPDKGSDQQDVTFVFDNVGRDAMEQLELASQKIDEPIKLVYRVFIDVFDNGPQTVPLRLMLTNISVDARTVSAMATRPDLYKRKLPTGNFAFYDQRFKGLWV